ncbi:MAG: ABC transporter ATP-binding protein [Candidatus Omnitrophota bacterium]|nr:ABC transporter ATP-binding protein/permease [Candidatus Omnitrophota bacterium]
MRDYLKLLRFVKPYPGLFIMAGICMLFSAVFDGVSLGMIVPMADKVLTNKQIIVSTKLPGFLMNLIGFINGVQPLAMLNYIAVATIFLFLFKGIFGFLQSYLMSDIGQLVVRDIRAKLYTKLHALSMDYFTQKRGGELISRITNDVKLVENAVSYGSTDMIYQTLQVILFTTLIFFIHWKMALTALVLLPLISLPIIKVGKVLRKLSRKTQEVMADINSILYESILGARIIKAFNMESYEVAKFSQTNQYYYRLSMKSIKRTLLLGPFTEILGAIAGIFVFLWAGKEVIAGKLSFGVFGLFMASLLSLIRPFKKLSQVNSIIQQAMAANSRIYEVLDTIPTVVERKNTQELNDFKNSLIFEDVWFNHGAQEIIRGINLEVKKGQVVGIVGPSGAGKTTLVDLIPRFYDPLRGRILIDGQDEKSFSLKSLRQQIGIVTQETILFNDTIRTNIAYGRPDASNEDIERAAMQSHAHDFIQRLPLGYDTFIGDRGMKLSGGERQRIAIARAILKDPPILILDEATSQLDTEAERLVQEAINKLIKGRTVFVIAHRLSTIRHVHRILVLKEGRIIEEGTHAELLEKQGLYHKLYCNQDFHKSEN